LESVINRRKEYVNGKETKCSTLRIRIWCGICSYIFGSSEIDSVILCDSDEERLNKVGDKFGINKRTRNFSDIVSANDIDAVCLVGK